MEIICPHCHNEIPQGASVCRGCQAEVEYGAPGSSYVLALFIAIYLGWFVGNKTMSEIGWAIFIAAFVGGIVLMNKIFKNRIKINRVYRTR